MTTTQPLTNQNLQATPTEDHMEMATSPYAQFDDIDFELDDNLESFAEQDGMIGENLNGEIKDDPMEDGSLDNNTIDYEADFIMDPDENIGGNEDSLEDSSVPEKSSQKHTSTNENPVPANSTVVEEMEGDGKADTFEGEDFLFEEEDEDFTTNDTSNTLTHVNTDITDNYNHESDRSTQNQIHSTNLTNADNEKDTTEVIQTATEKPAISDSKPDHSAATLEPVASGSEDENGSSMDKPTHKTDATHSGNEVIDTDISARQQPEIVPDEAESRSDRPNSPLQHPAAAHLHPVTLRYQDQDMSFFPPLEEDDSATYFLGDSSLAYEPFDKILAACRDLLGESIGHDDEMVIDIPSLGLHVCEDSKYATRITLAQVIDIYMLLSQNENLSPIKPLHCELSHRVCLNTQMAYLASSAREGKTYSAIVSEHMDVPEFDDSGAEEYAEPTAYQDDLEEVDSDEESDTADTFRDSDPTSATDNFQTSQGNNGEQLHHATKESASPKPMAQQNGFDDKPSESRPTIDSTNNKPELSSHEIENTEHHSLHSSEGDQGDLPELEAETFDPEETELLETDEIDFALGEDDLDRDDKTDIDHLTLSKHPSGPETTEDRLDDHVEPTIEITDATVDELDNTIDGPVSSGALLATPSKSNGKRKLMDDEDFLEIDISTPEPKRRRPS